MLLENLANLSAGNRVNVILELVLVSQLGLGYDMIKLH